MNNMKVSSRLALGFGLLIALLAIVDFIGVTRLAGMHESIDTVVSNRAPKVAALEDTALKAMDNARVVRNIVLLTDAKGIASNKDAYDKNNAVIDEHVAYLEKHIHSAEDKERLKAMREARAAYTSYTGEVVKLAMANSHEEATKALYGENYKSQAAYFAAIKKLVESQKAKMDAAGKDAETSYQSARTIMLALGLLACLVGAGMGYFIARSLLKQLGGEPTYAAAIAQRIAEGDLTTKVETKANDTTSLLASMKAMRDQLVGAVTNIREATESIGSASKQIASGNADLSQRTEEQASSLEETASSMEELTSTVKQNADNARQANQLAAGASSVAVKGGEVVGQVVQTMTSINDSSKKIADIIGVIDGIAFQTNILALNAAVEAARAGEQGRGFAVVASEVRSLAQRSAAAAKEIKELITDSVGKVESGTQLVDQAGKTMDEIVEAVKRVTDIMAEISAASQEQSSGIEQVNQAVTQMDEATQQNAALVEEAAAAAESMQEQASNLTQAVSVFKVAHDARAHAAAPAQKAVATVTPLPVKPAAKAAATPAPARKPVARKVANSKPGDDGWEEF